VDTRRNFITAAIVGIVLILVAGNFLLGKLKPYNYGGLIVNEQAITEMLRNSPIMATGDYTAEANEARLATATKCIKDRIFIRLAHFNNVHAQMDCDKKLKDILFGFTDGLKEAGIINDQQCAQELDYIETMSKSSLFPDVDPVYFCNLAK